jgi:beta-lactamase class D
MISKQMIQKKVQVKFLRKMIERNLNNSLEVYQLAATGNMIDAMDPEIWILVRKYHLWISKMGLSF